jgi:hypothetical protein
LTQRIRWGPGREDYFRQWLRYDLDRTLHDRQQLEKFWRDLLEQYRAPEAAAPRRSLLWR